MCLCNTACAKGHWSCGAVSAVETGRARSVKFQNRSKKNTKELENMGEDKADISNATLVKMF